ncbi:MAG: ABC-F family ATP-binding cassette domain-containing protein [Clostridia bacterium]|nr:ABC-F family ATP-binding cassette domain-containing protein [Clostridia bacterium]
MQYKITNGSFSYGANTILKSINFEIKDGEKIAICGRNGSGKTTLLKIITQELELDKDPSNIIKIGINQIGYLKQVVFTDENITLEDEILKVYSSIISMQNQLENLQKEMELNPTEKNIKNFVNLEQKFKDNDGYFYKKEYNSNLKAFKFTEEDKHKRIGEFSGGQRTKIAFIKLLLSKPDILLFDEPTNHLDIDSIEWLEDYLSSYKKCLVVVSHDRDFLDKVVNVVYEIEYGETKRYLGNYTSFVEQKKLKYERDLQDYKLQQEKIKKEEELIERFRYKATKASMVQSRIKALDKMDKLENPQLSDTKSFKFKFYNQENTGKQVLEINNLKIGYDKVLAEINLKVMRGERVGIIGGNGIGKSTLLKTLSNKIPKLDGEFSFGYNVNVGYFEQQTVKHTNPKTVYEDYMEEFPQLTETQLRNDLGAFLFSQEDIYKRLCDLSGGEMVRLELLKMFKKNPNVLLLDEPTNHMDLVGKETLENILIEDYKGAILVVSHDRYFIKKVTTSLLVFENDKVVYYEDGYNQYLEKKKKEKEDDTVFVQQEKSQKNLSQSNIEYLKSKEKAKKDRMMKSLEEKIKVCEKDLEDLKIKINTPEVFENVERLLKTNNEIQEKENQLDLLMEKWFELSQD